MPVTLCNAQYCRFERVGVCTEAVVTVKMNLHDGPTCISYYYARREKEAEDGAERTEVHETEHQEHLSEDG